MAGLVEYLLDPKKSSQSVETRSSQGNRSAVLRQGATGVSLSITIFTVGWFLLPAGTETDFPSHTEKLVYTLRWQLFSLMTLLYSVKQVADSRFSSKAIDPVHGSSEHLLIVDTKILQNTLEQVVLNVPVQWILTTYLSASAMPRVIPSLVTIFVLGRILFYIGYHKHPMKRSYGMAMTGVPTVATYFYCLFCFVFYHLVG